MKKFAIIFLLFIYSVSSMGATVHLHYCMSELVGWSITEKSSNSKCSKCGMKEKKGGCCKNEKKQLKIKSDQQKVSAVDFIKFIDNPTIPTSFIDYDFSIIVKSLVLPTPNAPPDILQGKLYMLFCVYLI